MLLAFINIAKSFAGHYYVDNAGSDSNDGLSPAAAWRTISKVNGFTFSSGDTISFKCGGSWNEKLTPPVSNLYFNSYSSGVKPVITGFQTQTGFTNVGNVWTATATNSVPVLNTVLIDGVIRGKGRYPNTGYLTYSNANSTTSKIVGNLSGFPDYSGAEMVIRTQPWINEIKKVSSQVADSFFLSSAVTNVTGGGNGYFIENIVSVLDTLGEWTFDSTSKALKVYATGSPSVQISNIDTLVRVKKDYITFEGLKFTGANTVAMQLDTANHITIQNCTFNNNGYAITAKKSDYYTIKNDSILNSTTGGLILFDLVLGGLVNTCNYGVIDNNYFLNTGIINGLSSGSFRQQGMQVIGLETQITNNKIDSTGYIPIYFIGKKTLVKNNYVTNYLLRKDDGGGIYTYIGTYYPADNSDSSIIRSNIVTNGIGTSQGIYVSSIAAGIYLDNFSRRITVDSNTVSNTVWGGIYFNQSNEMQVFDNTIIDSLASCAVMHNTPDSLITFKRNICYQQSTGKFIFYRTYADFTGNTIDSNYYLQPIAGASKFTWFNTPYSSLSAWTAATGYDVHTLETPAGITYTDNRLVINPTLRDSVVSLTGSYVSAKGVVYINKIILSPYSSGLLFKTDTDIKDRLFTNFQFYNLH